MTSSSPLTGDALLTAVSDSMAALHEHYHGRAPATARTQMLGDDLLACVLGRIYSEVEMTMIELERTPLVHEVRSAFHLAMQPRFVAEVERLSDGGLRASSRPITSDPTSRSSSSFSHPSSGPGGEGWVLLAWLEDGGHSQRGAPESARSAA